MTRFENADVAKLPRAALLKDSETPGVDTSKFADLLKRHKISADEYIRVRSILNRAPTLSELGIFSAMWSEHCSYKSSRVHLQRFPTKGTNVVVGPGENAGVVRLSGKLCVAFKMESHNHPSYIEPYQGAATGVGGILRDVFCMGARPVANLNCLRFGEKNHPRTPYLHSKAIKGIGDYGNCIGVPTVGGNISFDASYNGNCLVNAMTVGIIHEDRIFKGFATGPGNLVIYVGSATGRDGIHGATMASGSFASDESQERSTVQVGDPFTEKLLLEATLEVLEKGLVIGLQDMGAAGLTSSSFEMAGRAGNGLELNLDLIPVRTTAMSAYELMLSESQERMLMVVEPNKWAELQEVLDRWQLANAVIGTVTTTARVQAYRHGILEIDIPVLPLTEEAPKYSRPLARRKTVRGENSIRDFNEAIVKNGFDELLKKSLERTGSCAPVIRQYDQHIGTQTVLGSHEHGAALLWMRSEWSEKNAEFLGLGISTACNQNYTAANAHIGAGLAVVKCARMLAAVGANPLAITDCLNFGNPEDPSVMAEFSDAVDGISEACRELEIPVVSGNVSLYNETDTVSIKPTPMIGMVGKVDDVRNAPKAIFENPGKIFAFIPEKPALFLVGSLAEQIMGIKSSESLPSTNWELERKAQSIVRRWCAEGHLSAARDIGQGGLIVTALKMALPANMSLHFNQLGLKNYLEGTEFSSYPQAGIFAELGPAFILQLNSKTIEKDYDLLMKEAETAGFSFIEIGEAKTAATAETKRIEILERKISWSELFDSYSRTNKFAE